jgi:hypothetical protein
MLAQVVAEQKRVALVCAALEANVDVRGTLSVVGLEEPLLPMLAPGVRAGRTMIVERPELGKAAAPSGFASRRSATATCTSIRSFAANPGTAVEPMWSMRSARSPSTERIRRASRAKSRVQRSEYGSIATRATERACHESGERPRGSWGRSPSR